MNPTLKQLREAKNIISAQKLRLSSAVLEKLGPEISKTAISNARHINVYTFRYLSGGHPVAGFLIEPKKMKKPYPAVVFNRGGSEDFGIMRQGSFFLKLGTISRWGYVVIGSQYSGNSLSEGHDEHGGKDLNDVLNLYPILKGLKNVDSKRIGMYGGSRGGMMTYLALAKAAWIRAAVIVAGTTNLTRQSKLRPKMNQVYKKAFGNTAMGKRQRSAIFWVKKLPKDVPILLMHGTSDWRVSPLDSLDMAQELYKSKKPFRAVFFEGGDHSLNEFKNETAQLTREWFDRFLKEGDSLPDLKPHGN